MGSDREAVNKQKPKYWFPAKRYGWGWGLPNTWQGWVVIAVWLAILYPTTMWLLARNQTGLFVAFMLAMIAVLTLIGYLKGEPPRWRWGGK